MKWPNPTSSKNDVPFNGLAIARYFVNGVFSFAFFVSMGDAMALRTPEALLDSFEFLSLYFRWASSLALEILCYTIAIKILQVSTKVAMARCRVKSLCLRKTLGSWLQLV